MNKAELLDQIQASWDETNAFLAMLSTGQKTQPTDAGGWSVKDHVMHLAIWEDGLTALLDKQLRRERMDIDEATWKSGDDAINAVIQKRYQDLAWDEVEGRWQAIHNTLLKQIDGLSEETLQSLTRNTIQSHPAHVRLLVTSAARPTIIMPNMCRG